MHSQNWGGHRQSRLVAGTSYVRWKEGIVCLEGSVLKMHRHSFKSRMKYTILCQRLRLCFVFLKSSTPAYVKIMDIFTLIGLWEIVPLGSNLNFTTK